MFIWKKKICSVVVFVDRDKFKLNGVKYIYIKKKCFTVFMLPTKSSCLAPSFVQSYAISLTANYGVILVKFYFPY